MVVPAGLEIPPIEITIGTLLPVTPVGIVTLNWIAPVIKLGAPPAKSTIAGCPPTVAVTVP